MPKRVFVLSDNAPKIGSRNKERMLSKDIMNPEKTSLISKLFFRICGISPSYNCQNALIKRNAKPAKSVLFVLSFSISSFL